MTGVVVLVVVCIIVVLAVTRPMVRGDALPSLKINWRTTMAGATPCTWCRSGNCGACEDPTCPCFEMHVAQATGVEPAARR